MNPCFSLNHISSYTFFLIILLSLLPWTIAATRYQYFYLRFGWLDSVLFSVQRLIRSRMARTKTWNRWDRNFYWNFKSVSLHSQFRQCRKSSLNLIGWISYFFQYTIIKSQKTKNLLPRGSNKPPVLEKGYGQQTACNIFILSMHYYDKYRYGLRFHHEFPLVNSA